METKIWLPQNNKTPKKGAPEVRSAPKIVKKDPRQLQNEPRKVLLKLTRDRTSQKYDFRGTPLAKTNILWNAVIPGRTQG